MENSVSFEHIESYLEGQLSPEQTRQLEQQLAKDKPLANRLAKHQAVHQALKKIGREQIKTEVAEIHQRLKSERKKVVFPSWSYAMAAAILVLAFLAVGYIWIQNQYSNQAIFKQQFAVHDLRTTIMGAKEKKGELFAAFETAYAQGNYAESILKGENYLRSSSQAPSLETERLVLLGLANAYLTEHKAEQAIPYLQTLLKQDDQQEVARWYLGLAYLELEQEAEAREIFEQIVNDSTTNFKQSSAQEILDKMDSIWR